MAIASRPVSTNQGFKSFVPPKGLLSDYLYYYLQRAKQLALELASGTTFQEISGQKAAQIPLPIPPEVEQVRIIAKIEELFSDLDAGIAALERGRKNLERYRASVLKAAVEGRLTEQWRAENPPRESASDLLRRILDERRRKWEEDQLAKYREKGQKPPKAWQDRYEEPEPPDTSDLPELPEGWCWATVDQCTYDVRYGSSSKTTEDPDGIPVLRMGNIQDGELDIRNLKYLPENHAEFPDLLLKIGDLLFNRTNSAELVGKTAVYRGVPFPCSYASYLIVARFVSGCDPALVSFTMNSAFGRRWIASVVCQQVGQANVNGSKLRSFAFPLPPFEEQANIVAKVDELLSGAKAVSDISEKAIRRSSRLRQSILKRAFDGKLVPQDPTDEPASMLLERIRAEREANGNGRKRGRRTAREAVRADAR